MPDPQLARIRVALRANGMSDKGSKAKCVLRLLLPSAKPTNGITKKKQLRKNRVCADWRMPTLKDVAYQEKVRVSGNKAELVHSISSILLKARSIHSVVKNWAVETLRNICRDMDEYCGGNKADLAKRVARIIRTMRA